MIKTFEQFINENYNEKPVLAFGEEYGAPLFNEISESMSNTIYNSINEGKLVVGANMIEEGFFDSIGKLFKKGSDAMDQKIKDKGEEVEILKDTMEFFLNNIRNPYFEEPGEGIEELGKNINDVLKDEKLYRKIEELCKSAEEICAKLAEKEAETYKTISEKMTAANEAIKTFTKNAIAKIKEIVEMGKNKVSTAISVVMMFCKRMAHFAMNAVEKLAEGVVLAFTLPFILAFAIYKGTLNICNILVEKVKDGAKIVKEVFGKIKDTITTWVSDALTKAKELLKSACDAVKDGAQKAYNAIGKTYLAIVATLGQLASDVKDKITEAYNKFVDGVKDFSDEVKAYVSEKWETVSKWCKKTSTAFAEGVKSVWEKTKEKVMGIVGSVKDEYQSLKDDANAAWDEVVTWNDERIQNNIKAKMKYAADKWGKDTVASWINEL